MKKIILLLVLLVSAIAMNAATYRVKYDVQNQRSTNFTVSVGYDRLTINQSNRLFTSSHGHNNQLRSNFRQLHLWLRRQWNVLRIHNFYQYQEGLAYHSLRLRHHDR